MARREISEETWALVRKDWESGLSGKKCADKHKVSRGAIQNRITQDGWTLDPLLQEAVASKAMLLVKSESKKEGINSTVHGKAGKRREQSAAADPADTIERIARDRADLILEHQDKWLDLDEIYADAMRLLKGEDTRVLVKPKNILGEDGVTIVEKAEVLTLTKRVNLAMKLIALYEGASRGLMTKQEGERRAFGFDYKTQLEDKGVDEAAIRRKRELAKSVIEVVNDLKARAGVTNPTPPTHPPTIEGQAA